MQMNAKLAFQQGEKWTSFQQGVESNELLPRQEKNCMSIDKNYFALLLALHSLHSCKLASIESEWDKLPRMYPLGSRQLSFPLKYKFLFT